MDENPNVTVVQNKAATSNDARANYFQKLGKKGLADVEAIEVDWLPEVMQYSDLLAEVPSGTADRWLDWKVDAATDADGRLIGYGTDIGPEGVCYRSDLFAAAGLPTDRERSPRCSRATGTSTSRSARSTPPRPARRGSTPPAAPTRA